MSPRAFCLLVLVLAPALSIGAVRPLMAQDAASPQAARGLNPLADIDFSSLAGFRERPLFSPTRTPPDDFEPEISATDRTAAVIETLNIRLLGVVVTPGTAVAHVQDLDDAATRVLKVGDTIDAWTVKSIDTTGLVVEKNEEVKHFTLFKNDGP